MAVASLIWEVVQLPLYTLWTTASAAAIAWAVLHCTAGDVLIAAVAFVVARVMARGLPRHAFVTVLVSAGVTYTIFSEWLNVSVSGSWAYAPEMPVVPPFGTGLSPLLQWVVLPPLAVWLASGSTKTRA